MLLQPIASFANDRQTDSLLQTLDYTLANQTNYDKQRLNRLAALKAELHSGKADLDASFDLVLLICNEYQVFKYDSAFAYSLKLGKLARTLRNPTKIQTARTKLAFTLRSGGLYKDAFDTLRAINRRLLAPQYRAEFYSTYSLVYTELAEYNQDSYYSPFYTAKSYAYADTSARYGQPGSYLDLSQQLFRAKQQNDLAAGKNIYRQLRRLPLTAHQLAISSSDLAKLYEYAGQCDLALHYMTLAAINDIKSSTKEGIALFNVSDYCYQRGDLQRAYRYIKEARHSATFYSARQRLVQMSPISSLIDGQKITIVEKQRREAKRYALAIGVLASLLLGTAFVIYFQLRRLQSTGRLLAITNQELNENNTKLHVLNDKQHELNKKLRELNQGLNEANHLKEEYIGYYFNNTSRYIDKLEVLQKKLNTLLSTKQVAAAQQLVKDIDIKSERTALFKGFDTAFIHLFPNFVAEFNALFTEADRIQLAENSLLTTELRIFALIRLGINDNEQISRILGYSIHTVYAYKTRVKNRSFLPNEAFEARVLAIQAT
ncbi:DUF6377 domain-containing protein [Hymenobacter crusticola]|uniref:DUF6377 domain-containing protein n=1 Tax=Hymenobacter crusticola TaxID=1770526 RepID=A0A243WC83_9BACT|nr:DUF6377 domain-containing protein [Hymenobacter crusticola]OUJ72351.1 hypothetical protein BXP70_19045 [Hymenobacter crusticola]